MNLKRSSTPRPKMCESGHSEKRFYRELIRKADERFEAHLTRLKRREN